MWFSLESAKYSFYVHKSCTSPTPLSWSLSSVAVPKLFIALSVEKPDKTKEIAGFRQKRRKLLETFKLNII